MNVMENPAVRPADARPLCVDLDGTLVRTDTLVESVFALLKRNTLYMFLLPLWLLGGKANVKAQIARRIEVDGRYYPYHETLVDYLREQKAAGRRLALATAANEKIARAIASHLGLFDDVFASDDKVNLSGRRKLARLQEAYGEGGFDYAANAKVDLPIWQHANAAILVNPEAGVRRAAEKRATVEQVFDDRAGGLLKPLIKALRLHQWAKNALLFVPLFMAHQLHDTALLLDVAVAFIAFGLCASSVYLLNDLLDLPDDRGHPTKRNRPFAAGRLSVWLGAAMIPILLTASFGLAWLVNVDFTVMLAVYYVTTLSYSFRLKTVGLLDVMVLAGLYTLRVISGGVAAAVPLSFWLLAFSMFLFLSLALVKRYTEMLTLSLQGERKARGRKYWEVDLETLAQFGSSSAFMAVMVLALYIDSDEIKRLYTHPEVIWLLCPLMLYMIGRIWLQARRNLLHEDPVVFVMRDPRSVVLALIGAVLLWAAI